MLPAVLKPTQEDTEELTQVTRSTEWDAAVAFLRLSGGVPSVAIPKLVSEKMLCTTLPQAISGLSLGHLALTHPPPSSLQAPSHLCASSNSGLKGLRITERVLAKLTLVARLQQSLHFTRAHGQEVGGLNRTRGR